MSGRLAVSAVGMSLIRRFEGFRPLPTALPQGGYVYGYGHVAPEPPSAAIAEETALELLKADVEVAAESVRAAVFAPVSQNQFDALVSLAFSIGPAAFRGSDVVKRLNAGEVIAAANGFDVWRRSAVIDGSPRLLDALVRRRAAEKALFLTVSREPSAPSALLRPMADHAVALVSAPGDLAAFGEPDAGPLSPPRGPGPAPNLAAQTPRAPAETARLRAILASEPQTAHALEPPARQEDEAIEEAVIPPPSPSAKPLAVVNDQGLIVAIGATGAVMLAAAAFAHFEGWRQALLFLGAPGAMLLLVAAYFLAKPRAV